MASRTRSSDVTVISPCCKITTSMTNAKINSSLIFFSI
uniref:Uncharacterized protein n=1 Tax=Arundo donax TaxID=35708 RepID=A0A0A9GQT7_ARUDO